MKRFAVLIVSLGLGVITTAWATDVPLSPPGTEGWQPLDFPSIKRHTTYTVVHADDQSVLKAVADCSASALYLRVRNLDLHATPRLHWRWKIDRALHVADERVKAGDDFAARVYLTFRFEAARASLWERARHRFATLLYRKTIPGSAINYVWSSHTPAGATWESPYESESKLVSLGPAQPGVWRDETVDVVTDYLALFGHAPPPLLDVAVMTDTDNSCQQATAYYADFKFVSR